MSGWTDGGAQIWSPPSQRWWDPSELTSSLEAMESRRGGAVVVMMARRCREVQKGDSVRGRAW